MVLNSQIPRSGPSSNYQSIRRLRNRRRTRLLLVVVVLVVLALWGGYALGWWDFGWLTGAVEAPGAGRPSTSNTPTNEEPTTNRGAGEPVEAASNPGSQTEPPGEPKPEPPSEPNREPMPAMATEPVDKPSSGDGRVEAALRSSIDAVNAGKLVEARKLLIDAYAAEGLPGDDAQRLRAAMMSVNEKLVFSKQIAPGDPLVQVHVIQSGDTLSEVKKIKLLRGPFHAVVDKGDYRVDLYLGGVPGTPGAVYVRSFPVGLGQGDSTPLGSFLVTRGKVKNPDWRNPRNPSEYYPSSDPKNPIGEWWIGLRGADEKTKGLSGYGIHGTIEPDSIGRQASMGCVRMLDGDAALMFEMLVEESSTVTIVP